MPIFQIFDIRTHLYDSQNHFVVQLHFYAYVSLKLETVRQTAGAMAHITHVAS